MVIVLRPDISRKEKSDLKNFLTEKKFKISEVRGEEETVFAIVGKLSLDIREVELLPGVGKVIPVSNPYKLASRKFKKEDTIVTLPFSDGSLLVGGNRLCAIAGPGAVESKEGLFNCAKFLVASGANVLRSAAFVQNVSPYAFSGEGKKALVWLKEAGQKYNVPVCTEVSSPEQLSLAKDFVDIIQIGPENMSNTELLKKTAELSKPVILCRSRSATVEEFLLSAEFLLAGGSQNVILCESGIRTFEQMTQNTLDLSAVALLKELTHLPVIVDPSMALGVRDKVPSLSLASVASGADGIAVDVSLNPEKALFGGARSLYPDMFDKLMHDIRALSPVVRKVVVNNPPVKKSSRGVEKTSASKTEVCVYSGSPGAYAEQAVNRYFDEGYVKAKPVDSFAQIFQTVTDSKAKYGMVPIENSLSGSVFQNYDNFLRFEDVDIVGAVTLNIRHALLGVKGASLEDVKNVYSHPQGFSQCKRFLDMHKNWTCTDSLSTATAAKTVQKKASKQNAAIASAVNASIYKLSVLAEDIADDSGNFTRFVVISHNKKKRRASEVKNANMASFLFKIKNEPGALCRALSVFESYKLNLTRLESRPIHGEPWRYWFYADADIHDSPAIKNGESPVSFIDTVIGSLSKHAEDIRLLGIYSEIRF